MSGKTTFDDRTFDDRTFDDRTFAETASGERRPHERFRLNEKDREAIARKVSWKLRGMYEQAAPPVATSGAVSPVAPGIHVLSSWELAEVLGKSRRHLVRLEGRGDLPRRRRISRRRTGYLAHELQGLSAASVVVQGPRTLDREQLAEKLGMNERTVTRMVQQGEMPRPKQGRWLEGEIDAWLLERPRV